MPEVDDNGFVKQCLPGNTEYCGSGYSCNFSGTNYHCCPTEDAINLDSILECPSPSITILTDSGLPLTCIPGIHDCPQSSMQCLNVGKHSICCEGLASSIQTSHGAFPPNELNVPEANIFSNELNIALSLECPEPAFTIIDGNGDPVPCSDEDCTHQKGRFCYKALNTTICCEGEEKFISDEKLIREIIQEKREKEGNIGWNVLNYTPLKTAQHQVHESESSRNNNRLGHDASNVAGLPIFDERASEAKLIKLEIISPITDGSAKRPREKQLVGSRYDNSQQSITPDNMKTSQTITTIATMTTTTTPATTVITSLMAVPKPFRKLSEDETETIRYKPHSAGGYAVSQAFSSKISRAPDFRALAQDYLLEHIKRGWPYSDEFYRANTPFESQRQEDDQEDEIIFRGRS